MIISELKELGFSNMDNFMEEGEIIANFADLARDKLRAVGQIKKTVMMGESKTGGEWEKTTLEFRLHDKLSALDKLAKHLGFYHRDNAQTKPQVTQLYIMPSQIHFSFKGYDNYQPV